MRRRRQKGLAAVELVIGLPILLLLLVGVVEVARAFVEMNTLTKSIRVGARYASTLSQMSGCGPVMAAQDNVKHIVVYGTLKTGAASLIDSLSTTDVTVNCENNLFVTVSATYTFQPIFADKIPYSDVSLALPMNAATVMRLDQ